MSDMHQHELPHANQAHVWLCRLEVTADHFDVFRSHLSADESKRARQFIVEQARKRFIVGRGVLRSLLGGYLAMPSYELKIKIDSLGKPRLDGTALRFNLAHSGEWLIVGFAVDNEIGIDIERHRPVRNWRSIAERHFSPSELAAFPADDSDQPPEIFFRTWTRKEAILKWHGTGLRTPLSSFNVPTGEKCGEWVELSNVQERCWVKSLYAPAGYSAALATSQPCNEIALHRID